MSGMQNTGNVKQWTNDTVF